jgi:hypothetical protein
VSERSERTLPAAVGHRPIGRLATVLAVAFALGAWPSPASAHRDIVLTVHTDGRGSVWVTAAWIDGHPVAEAVGATLLATSARGERVGPVPLRQIADTAGTLVYEGTLGPGDWRVVAETGQPSIARCEADVRSADATTRPEPAQTRCAPVASPAGSTPGARSFTPFVVLGGVLTASALAYALARSRRPPTRRGTRGRGGAH